MLKNILLVGLGSSIGGMLRYVISLVIKNNSFPYATLTVNIIGSFCIGLIFAFSIKEYSLSDEIRFFFATGICGGFTTFSAFSLENIQLIKSTNYSIAFLYITLSILLRIAAVFAGYTIMVYLIERSSMGKS